MKENEVNSQILYCPYIPVTTATYINGIKVWDKRWLPNLWCKIYLWLHPKKRKMIEEWGKRKVTIPLNITQMCKENNGEEV